MAISPCEGLKSLWNHEILFPHLGYLCQVVSSLHSKSNTTAQSWGTQLYTLTAVWKCWPFRFISLKRCTALQSCILFGSEYFSKIHEKPISPNLQWVAFGAELIKAVRIRWSREHGAPTGTLLFIIFCLMHWTASAFLLWKIIWISKFGLISMSPLQQTYSEKKWQWEFGPIWIISAQS